MCLLPRRLRLLPLLLSACAVEPSEPFQLDATPTEAPPDEPEAPPDDRVLPPPDWTPLARAQSAGRRPLLCLAFDGALVDSDESFIVPEGRAVRVPPFDVRSYGTRERGAAIAFVVGQVRHHFRDTALEVSTDCGGREDATRVLVGGTPGLVGEADGVAGVAPFDIGNRAADDVGFVFSDVLGTGRGRDDLVQLASTIAHEAGHTFGLDHVRPVSDLMHPTVNDAMEDFGIGRTYDGPWQDGPALLRAALGPEADAGAPLASCDGATDRSAQTRERAAVLTGRAVGAGEACAGDEDWFAFDATAEEYVEVELAYPDEGWVEPPAIFQPYGRRPVGEMWSTDGTHHVGLVVAKAGRHRVRITTPDVEAIRYALRIRRPEGPE